jgi:hypothetical protein
MLKASQTVNKAAQNTAPKKPQAEQQQRLLQHQQLSKIL